MATLRFNLTSLLFIFSISLANGQFYKRFSIELAVNKSKNYNKEEITTDKFGFGIQPEDIIEEAPTYTYNVSSSIGFNITKNHHVSIRLSKNTVGTLIDYSAIGFEYPIFQNFFITTNLYASNSFGNLRKKDLNEKNGLFVPLQNWARTWY